MTLSADLTGCRALVTGASSGLGRHFAGVLAAAGADVVLAARNVEKLAEVAAGLPGASTVALDVRSAASVQAAIASVGLLDVVINNAGVTNTRPVLDQTEAEWDQILDTNLKGAFLVATEAGRVMRDQGRGGSIINIASILGLRQGGQVTPYAVAKAGLVQMTRQLGLELARYDIRVNAIAPGYFETELNTDFFATPAGEALIKRVPQRRLGRLEDLNGPLLLLASDASRFMTGTVIPVDGGHLLSSL